MWVLATTNIRNCCCYNITVISSLLCACNHTSRSVVKEHTRMAPSTVRTNKNSVNMWFWIIFVSVVNMNFMFSMAENVGNEISDDGRDDSVYLYVDERPVRDTNQDKKDVETRSRSTLDKNFLRFGRSGREFYLVQDRPYDVEDMDYLDEFVRPARGAYDNYVRFGRSKDSGYVRFGRDPYKYVNREVRSNNDKNMVRFGRSVPVKRSRRDVSDNYEEQKRQRNMVRFGRNDKSMPNDRSIAYKTDSQLENYEEQKRQRNMVRFGRNDNSFRSMYETDSQSDNQNGSQANKENLVSPFYPINIVPLLKQLVARLRSDNNCLDCTRFG